MNLSPFLIGEQRITLFETLRPPLAQIAECLASTDPAESLAAAQALLRRYEEAFDDPQSLARAIAVDALFSFPYDTQYVLTTIFLAGLPFEIPPRPAHIVPDLAVRYRAAEIVNHIDTLPLSSIDVLDLHALEIIPAERAFKSGLWLHLAKHERPAVHERALRIMRESLELAWLGASDVAPVLVDLARRSSEAVAARCLDLLAEPCFEGMVCPTLHPWLASEDAAPSAVRLAVARRDVAWLRRLSNHNDVPRQARNAALQALGAYGDATDLELFVTRLEQSPSRFGNVALAALQTAKRRGISVDENQARVVIRFALHYEFLPLDTTAEVTGSRADVCLGDIDTYASSDISKTRVVSLLGSWATRNATARLLDMAQNTSDIVLARAAIRELGRLEERAAEVIVLARLEEIPDVCLCALGNIGGSATVAHLRRILHDKPPPWLHRALEVLFRLDPAPDLLIHVLAHGAISTTALDALPAYASVEQTDALASIASAPGHPFRVSAIGALGRTGGCLAIDVLGRLLTDMAEDIRTCVHEALRVLGARLVLPGTPLLSCLVDSNDPGGTLIAEAALRRLRQTGLATMEVALLLDAIKGHAHPHLARVVRPYLRRNNPEIRKRALACLAEAGPAASAWVLPYVHEDEPLPVVRQGLLALGKAEVPGLGQTIASWLFHGNMNIKKTAAELLANISDPGLAKMLVDVLAWQDQPGLRQLVEHALHTMAPRSARLLLVDKLLHTKDPRQQEQLASSLAPGLSAETFAALLAAHPKLPDEFVRTVIAAHAKDAARFDTALRRRDLGHRFPKTTDVAANHPQRPNLARSDLQRMLGRVRRHLLESPFAESVLPDTRHSLLTMAASFPGLGSELSALEQRLLANLGMHADEPLRQAILVLLADTTDAFVQARIQPWMRLEGEIDPRCEALLPAAVRRSNLSITRRFVNHPMLGVRAAAVRGQLISEEFHWTHSFVQERREVIRRWVQTGREHLLPNVILGQDQTTFLEAVQCLHIQLGKTAAWEFAQTFVSENPHERERYLLDVTYLGDCVLPWLLEFVLRCGEGSLRKRAIEELARMSLDDASTFLQSFLDDKHSGVVIVAAQSAIAMGNEQDRRRILDRWLEGKLAGGFHVPLRDQDVDQVLRAVENASTEAAQMHLYAPIEALPSLSRIQLWLRLRQSQHPRIAAAARDALRALPPADVWMTLEGPDRQKWFGFLDVLGPSAWLPPFLVEEAKTSDTPEDWMNFALRAAGQGLLYPGTLGRTIARWTADSVSPTAFSVLARLTDWYDDKQAAELLAELNPVLQSEHRERLVRMFEDALHEAPPSLIVRLLAPWVRPTDTVAVRMLANAEASSPGILALVGPELRAAMEGAMAKALEEADPETARTWLTYFAQRAEHAVERERVLVLLEKHIGSSSRRVRLHAHRLLRTLAPKERYVRASRRLLEDTDPTTLRLALRILAFGGDLESVDKFVEYLFHTHTAVARSAREGLLVLGPRAISHLLRIRNTQRPDRRKELDTIMNEIRRRQEMD